MLLLTLIFLVVNYFLAKRDANKISLNQPIDHLYNALLYSGMTVVGLIGYGIIAHFTVLQYVSVLVSIMFTRLLVFNIALSILTNKAWYYLSLTTTSKIDQFTNKIFGYNGKVKYLTYGILFLINLITYFI